MKTIISEQEISRANLEAVARQAKIDRQRATMGRRFNNILTVILYFVIAFIFVAPLMWVLGNSFRSSQSIWANVYPISWKTFIPFDEFSFYNYAEALGLTTVGQGLGLDLSRALFISLASAITVVIFP